MGLSSFDRVLWLASALLATGIVWRIFQQRLFLSPYRAFVLMLGLILLRDVAMAVPRYNTHAFTATWEWTLPLLLATQIAAGWETLKAVARLYPRIGKFALRLFFVCLTLTTAFCCLGLPLELRRLEGQETVLRTLFLLQRWVDSCIAGTLILVAIFLARFPAPMKQPPRNLVLHTILLSAYFGGYAVLFFTENLAPLGGVASLERLQLVFVILLYSAWAVGLSQQGSQSESWPEIDVLLLKSTAQGQ